MRLRGRDVIKPIFVYVGNLVDSVTETHVVEYTKRNGVEVRSCYMLKSKIYGTNSARIKVAIQDKDKILDSSFWPENVRVRSWVFKPRWARQGSELSQDE